MTEMLYPRNAIPTKSWSQSLSNAGNQSTDNAAGKDMYKVAIGNVRNAFKNLQKRNILQDIDKRNEPQLEPKAAGPSPSISSG